MKHRSAKAGVIALASSAMLASFLQTIMTPLIPSLPRIFDASAAAVSWTLTAALLAACATAPIAGRIGDIVGKKRVLLVLLGIILAGSLVGAMSTTLAGVISARALQGVGLGVMALNVSALRETVRPARLPAAVAAVSASNGIGGALGLPLSAVVSEYFDWHGLFWLAAILAALSAIAIAIWVPSSVGHSRGRFDWVGGLGLAIGLSAVMLTISQGAEWGWLSPTVLALGIGGIAMLVAWTRHELRTHTPLIDLRLNTRGPVLVANLIGVTSGFCWFAVPGLVARLLQSSDGPGPGFELDMVTASLIIVPTGLGMLFFAPLAQRLVRRFGPRPVIRTGSILTAVAFLYGLLTMHELWQLSIVAGLVGVGSVLIFSSLSLVIMANVPKSATGAANGVNAVSRWIGSTTSSAVLGAILATMATTYGPNPVPTSLGYHLSFAIAAGAGLVGFFLGAFLPRPAVATSGKTTA